MHFNLLSGKEFLSNLIGALHVTYKQDMVKVFGSEILNPGKEECCLFTENEDAISQGCKLSNPSPGKDQESRAQAAMDHGKWLNYIGNCNIKGDRFDKTKMHRHEYSLSRISILLLGLMSTRSRSILTSMTCPTGSSFQGLGAQQQRPFIRPNSLRGWTGTLNGRQSSRSQNPIAFRWLLG
jgi:hypothetical protein